MGNRAIVATADKKPCFYLQWNGGEASIEGFLGAFRHLYIDSGLVSPKDPAALKHMAKMIRMGFFESSTLNVYEYDTLNAKNDCSVDNGIYFINSKFKISRRKFAKGWKQAPEVNPAKTEEIKAAIIKRALDNSPEAIKSNQALEKAAALGIGLSRANAYDFTPEHLKKYEGLLECTNPKTDSKEWQEFASEFEIISDRYSEKNPNVMYYIVGTKIAEATA